jgi:hypothetical protein
VHVIHRQVENGRLTHIRNVSLCKRHIDTMNFYIDVKTKYTSKDSEAITFSCSSFPLSPREMLIDNFFCNVSSEN